MMIINGVGQGPSGPSAEDPVVGLKNQRGRPSFSRKHFIADVDSITDVDSDAFNGLPS